MHVLLCANAPLSLGAATLLQETAKTAQLLVGVDGGARALRRLGLTPALVTGDGDSLTRAEREALVAAGATLVPTPNQDYTDLDKALACVLERYQPTQLTVFGATGGRLDHTYSSFSALVKYGRKVRLELVDETAHYALVSEHWQRTDPSAIGCVLSLLALGRVEGVTTTGVLWPLTNAWLAPGLRDGTLNQITEETVQISVTSGDLIVMWHHTAEAD